MAYVTKRDWASFSCICSTMDARRCSLAMIACCSLVLRLATDEQGIRQEDRTNKKVAAEIDWAIK